MIESRDSRTEKLWSGMAFRMLVDTVSHPLHYAKVLIQIGHEPIPPWATRTFFGTPALALPNIFQYVRYIKTVDGFTGCYRGLVPRLCAYSISAVAIESTGESILFTKYYPEIQSDKDVDVDDLPDEQRRAIYIRELVKDITCRVAGIIISHPLDVITIRTMAQFVGGETKYNGIFSSILEIYRENGLSGFYSGLLPRLIANISTLVLVSGTTYIINKHFIRDREIRGYTADAMTFLSRNITDPFLVVYHCMAVNNCGLTAGMPPQMPIYNRWTDCWKHLSSIKGLKRGSSVLWRYYTAPQIM